MDTLDFSRSRVLNNIPNKKLREAIQAINNSDEDLEIKHTKLTAINRYAESNIPIEYWTLKMERDFQGDPRLLNEYNKYIEDIKSSYINGNSICLSGIHGSGKTMALCCILKKVTHKGYAALYTTLSDIVSSLTQSSNEDKFSARRELVMVDFLVIDEFDGRFMATDNGADLYARSLESIFRARSQNKLPTLMATNSPNIIEVFKGPLKDSLDSLMKGYMKTFSVLPGKDFRKQDK
jgi:DNA replication protein DnaC